MARVSAVQKAIDSIRARIRSGEWPTGSRLPSETELTAMLGLSRSPLREAVRALVHTGMLTVHQGDGTYVAATDEASAVLTRRALDSRVTDVLDVRVGLDAVCAELAARRRTDDDLVCLHAALEERRQAVASGQQTRFAHADAQFHFLIAQAAHNPLLSAVYRGVVGALARSVDSAPTLHHAIRDRRHDHEALLGAVEDSDPVHAASIALEILRDQRGSSTPPDE